MDCSGSTYSRSDPSYYRLPKEKDAPQPLNVIILGGHKVGKSTVGNAILGRKAFNFWSFFFNGCVEKQRRVNGRFIKVVHAPGWTGFNHTTSEYNKKEIMTSVFRCSEGHVACMLVVSIDSETPEKDRKAAEQHMELIGGSVWQHTALVFITRKPDERNQRVENIINKHKWLREKCGSWYTFSKDNVNDLIEKLVGAATWYNGTDSCFKANNSAFSQESQMDSRCPEEITETENGTHELSSASENTSGQLRKVFKINVPSGPDSQQDADPPPSSSTSTTREVAQAEGQENKKLLQRRHSMLMAIKIEKQEMAKLCCFLITLTKITGPIDENLKDFKHQSVLFVDENRAKLIKRVITPIPIADSLFAKNMIDLLLYDEILMAGTHPERMRLIYTALNAKVKKVAFLELLVQKERFLVQDLAMKKLQELEASDVDMP